DLEPVHVAGREEAAGGELRLSGLHRAHRELAVHLRADVHADDDGDGDDDVDAAAGTAREDDAGAARADAAAGDAEPAADRRAGAAAAPADDAEQSPVARGGVGAPFPVDRLDDALGDALERAIRAHHRRRLARRGHEAAFDPPAGGWAASGAFSPRGGCGVELLVDGAELLPRMVEDVSAASSHVHLAGWTFTPSFPMGEGGPTLRGLLAEAATRVDVRVLAWAGAPLPLFHPDRGEVRALRDELTRGTRIEMQLDDRERPMHCHHEKVVLVDDRIAYVGGVDLTSFGGNRLDSSEHP